MKNKKTIYGIVLLIIILVGTGVFLFFTNQNESNSNNSTVSESAEEQSKPIEENNSDIEIESVSNIKDLFLNESELPDGYVIADLGEDIGEFAKEDGQYKFKKEALCSNSSWEDHEACTSFSESYVQFITNETLGTSISVIYNTTSSVQAGEELVQTTIDGRERDDSFGLTCIPGGKARSEDYGVFVTVDLQEGDEAMTAIELFDSLIQKGNLISIVDCR